MHGFKKGVKPKSQHFANGGMVKGAGTGTSDDIKKEVSAGSYIMPADSTQKIGAPSLDALGFKPQAKVPVNLSNGEYEMPPEQVHAVGVQALDQMKEQTHTPVNQPQVQQGKGFKPEMFFADGGGVFDWVNKNLLPETSRVVSETNDTVNKQFDEGNYLRGVGAGLGGGVKAAGGLAYDTIARPVGGIASGIGEVGKGFFEEVGKDFFWGDNSPTPSAVSPVTAAAPKSPPTTAKTVPNPMAVTAAKTAQGFTQPSPTSTNMEATPQDTSAQAPTQPAASASGIIRYGNNSFGDGRSAGVGADGITSTNPQWNSQQNIAAKNNLFGSTPTFGEGQPQQDVVQARGFAPNNGRGVIIGQPEQSAGFKDAMRAASTPHKGAQNGQLTIGQIRAMADLDRGEKTDALSRYTTDANNATGLTKEQMSQMAANERVAMSEAGSNYRSDSSLGQRAQEFGATYDLENRKFNSDADSRGLVSKQARMTSKALAKYDAAKTHEERSSALAELQGLSGKNPQQDKYLVVGGGVDPTTGMPNPQRLFNAGTGQFLDQPNTQSAAPKQTFTAGKVSTDANGNKARWDGEKFVPIQ